MADEKTKAETPVPEQDETLKADAAIDPSVKDDADTPEEAVADIQLEDADTADNPMQALTDERDALKDQALRALAEVENMRRRTEREVSQSRKYGHAGFARDLLAVVDNIGRAVDALPEDRSDLDETMTNLVIGVEMIQKEIHAVLERHGITRIDPLGEKFDYDRHQAMFEIEQADVAPGTVVQVAQPGWTLHDRLLTPAMVGVAKSVSSKDDEKAE